MTNAVQMQRWVFQVSLKKDHSTTDLTDVHKALIHDAGLTVYLVGYFGVY